MFKHVIVGVDGTEGGRDALALAQALKPRHITLVAAYPAERVRWRGAVEGYFELLHDDAVKLLEEHRAGVEGDVDLVACPDPSPARALQRQAAERHADLIVIGSAHHGPVARLLLGDVGRAVLHGSPCAVAVAPRGFREHAGELRHVSVGLDDSPEARAALAVAAELADEHGAALATHTAWDISPALYSGLAYLPDPEQLAKAQRDHATAAVDAALTDFPRVERHIERGRAAELLESAARDADVLVVGSRGWGPARRIALGSTSDHLVHHAGCPVIVVPRPTALGDAEEAQDGAQATAAR